MDAIRNLLRRLRSGLTGAAGYIAAAGASFVSAVKRLAGIRADIGLNTHYEVECFGPDGVLKWREEFDNLVVTAGLNEALDKTFKASSYTAAWYVGLTAATPTFAAGDTMGSHAGWTEDQTYSESVRQTLTLGTVAAGSVNNSAAKATYSINGTITIGGAFLTTSNTKGGTTGTLYGGGAFSGGNKSLASGDTLQVTVTLTATPA